MIFSNGNFPRELLLKLQLTFWFELTGSKLGWLCFERWSVISMADVLLSLGVHNEWWVIWFIRFCWSIRWLNGIFAELVVIKSFIASAKDSVILSPIRLASLFNDFWLPREPWEPHRTGIPSWKEPAPTSMNVGVQSNFCWALSVLEREWAIGTGWVKFVKWLFGRLDVVAWLRLEENRIVNWCE